MTSECGQMPEQVQGFGLRERHDPQADPKQSEKGAVTPKVLLATVGTCGSVQRRLLIEWDEVDRLLSKAEYAAALLVAAVNVEFVLWEHLRRLSPAEPPLERRNHPEWLAWQKVTSGDRDSAGLGALMGLAQFFAKSGELVFSPLLQPFGWPLNEARKGIAHTRGYFAALTRLEDPDWPESRIRQILHAAKAFCHGNAP